MSIIKKFIKKLNKKKIYATLFGFPLVMKLTPMITRRISRRNAHRIVMRIPPHLGHFDAVIPFRGIKMKIFTGESMGRIMYYFGDWEPKQNDFFEAYIKPGMLLFDIGANMGFYSLFAATHGARSVAFEPDPDIIKNYLKFNTELNKVPDRIIIVNEAVADKAGTLKFYLHRPGSWGAGRIFKLSDENNPTIDVKTNSIDFYVQKYGKPDVIKMDIEGAEVFAIEGAENLLKRGDAPLLMIEFHPGEILEATGGGITMDMIINQLQDYGYKSYKIFELHEQNPTWYVFSKKEIPNDILATFTE